MIMMIRFVKAAYDFETAGIKDLQTKTLAADDLSHLEQWGPSPRHPGEMIYGRPMEKGLPIFFKKMATRFFGS